MKRKQANSSVPQGTSAKLCTMFNLHVIKGTETIDIPLFNILTFSGGISLCLFTKKDDFNNEL